MPGREVLPECRAALFDLDGTLVETHIDFPAMTSGILDLTRAHAIPGAITAGRDILGMVYASGEFLTSTGRDGGRFRVDAFAILQELEIRGCGNAVRIAGATEILRHLRDRGIRVAIVTRNCRAISTQLIRDFDLACDALFTRDDVPRTKPDPDHLARALLALSVPAHEAVMVGDHWMDIVAGHAAGCAATIGMLCGRAPEAFSPCPPSWLASDLDAALEYIVGQRV